MWVFYSISLPLTVGMVIFTLKYFAGPHVPRYVFFTVGYAWFCSFSVIVLVPADIWTTVIGHYNSGISFFWSWSYWSTFFLTWAVVPLIQGYEDAGDFTVAERLKTSVHVNLIFYLIVGSVAILGLILLISMHNWSGSWFGFAMACSNTFGLVTGAFLLGFGLSEIPRSLWKRADWTYLQKVLSHKIAKMAVKLDEAHQNFSNAIVVAQATSNQMSKRDLLRPYMDVIDKMLAQMLKEDPSFKPQGGRLGENDMEYDTDEKSMASLRRQLRFTWEEYYRYKSEYLSYVSEALELEDTVKNYERREATGWKYVSTFRGSRSRSFGSSLDTIELIWRCILRSQLQKLLAIILGCMSVAILLAEATLLPSVDLSLFSILIKAVGKQEVLVQALAFVPLMYMCVCTYYSLFKVGRLMFYSLTPRQTSSVNLLMICSMVARYAPPVSYNFLNLIRLDDGAKTIFEKRMGNIDDAVPFFGRGFNRIYPLIMVVYTLLVASNFFDRVIDFFGSWKRFRLRNEADDMDGFDPSGVIILQKERLWLEQGHKVGEQVIPLARNFNNITIDDVESATHKEGSSVELKSSKGTRGSVSTSSRDESRRYSANREAISHKYITIKEQTHQTSPSKPVENRIASARVSLLDEEGSSQSRIPIERSTSGLSMTWQSMKTGFQNLKGNIDAKKFIPLRQGQETKLEPHTSSESLDQIFQRLKRPSSDHATYSDDSEDESVPAGRISTCAICAFPADLDRLENGIYMKIGVRAEVVVQEAVEVVQEAQKKAIERISHEIPSFDLGVDDLPKKSPLVQALRPKLQYVRKVARDKVAGEVSKEQVNATTIVGGQRAVQDKVVGEVSKEQGHPAVQDKVAKEHVEEAVQEHIERELAVQEHVEGDMDVQEGRVNVKIRKKVQIKEEENKDAKEKRQWKPTGAHKSPFKKRKINIIDKPTIEEKNLKNGEWVENNVVDIWVKLLNKKEKLKSDSTPLRRWSKKHRKKASERISHEIPSFDLGVDDLHEKSPFVQALWPKLQYVRKVAKDKVAGEVFKEQVNATTIVEGQPAAQDKVVGEMSKEQGHPVVQDKVAGEHVEEVVQEHIERDLVVQEHVEGEVDVQEGQVNVENVLQEVLNSKEVQGPHADEENVLSAILTSNRNVRDIFFLV
ncbi:hypothetical protein V2J09_016520 [Rumex salicifolius]